MSNNKAFAVNLWGSHPDADNDDCWTGTDVETLDEALLLVHTWRTHFNKGGLPGYYSDADVAYIEVDGPNGFYSLVKNQAHKPACKKADGEWKREAAMQAGMAFGCDGYNDEMGC